MVLPIDFGKMVVFVCRRTNVGPTSNRSKCGAFGVEPNGKLPRVHGHNGDQHKAKWAKVIAYLPGVLEKCFGKRAI